MSFIQSCSIRKNTPELRNKLKELGYKKGSSPLPVGREDIYDRPLYLFEDKYHFRNTELYGIENNIDCETNEELFLALAALRNDSDKNQWFICREEYISNHTMDLIKIGTWQLNTQHDKLTYSLKKLWRKANKREIIKHFEK